MKSVLLTMLSSPDETAFFQIIKTKFLDGGPVFMTVIALTLVVGLGFCLERIIYLHLTAVNTRKFLAQMQDLLANNDHQSASVLAQNTRGPVAAIYYQALARIAEPADAIDRAITACGSVQVGLLERNLSWISLFTVAAPNLGFLGTVVGMVMAFDNIELFGDINPSIVAGGMKVALITTIAGLIAGLILQVFYNYILSKIEQIVRQMERDSIRITDCLMACKKRLGI
jgi:biopolymer transport protein ExbB